MLTSFDVLTENSSRGIQRLVNPMISNQPSVELPRDYIIEFQIL